MTQQDENSRKTILAVDDDPFIRKMFQSILGSKGFRVITANDGIEAISKATEDKPDLIFLDIMMPNMDGFLALEKLRNTEETKLIPVIIATARADSASLLQAIKLGANDFIAKPFTKAMIMRKIRFALPPENEQVKSRIERPNPAAGTVKTFIESTTFQEMRTRYIQKFDQVLISAIHFLIKRNKAELLNLCRDIENACKTYEIPEPLKKLPELLHAVRNSQWSQVADEVDKLYSIFKQKQEELDRQSGKKTQDEAAG